MDNYIMIIPTRLHEKLNINKFGIDLFFSPKCIARSSSKDALYIYYSILSNRRGNTLNETGGSTKMKTGTICCYCITTIVIIVSEHELAH